ncbi:hypothetical protein [Fodinibius salsisoli]|uniref:Multiubiquitin n=1 Tax=Fodinibius salsisoli TaxID=2820877 RepID=A0ABT3PJC9_9BACT|nr:hypothetical protein [Fodinibius salsisoli]MCW9705863.1 hypothetical protein [Fodinibius salsisoli]
MPPTSIKIKVEDHSYTKEDIEDLARWENEGGMPTNTTSQDSSSVNLPIKPGEVFKVAKSDLVYEDGKLYLQAQIDRLPQH